MLRRLAVFNTSLTLGENQEIGIIVLHRQYCLTVKAIRVGYLFDENIENTGRFGHTNSHPCMRKQSSSHWGKPIFYVISHANGEMRRADCGDRKEIPAT